MLIGAQIDEETRDDLDIEASAPLQVWSHLVKDWRERFLTLLLDFFLHIKPQLVEGWIALFIG